MNRPKPLPTDVVLQVAIDAKRYADGKLVLHQLKFVLRGSEFVAIVGPSGAGKSTLLNLLAGLDRDCDGRITRGPGAQPLGMMFQEPRLMPWLNLRDNLQLVLDRPAHQTIDAVLADVGLAEAANVFPAQLSGGMQRRAALARAFVVAPRLLMLDEPFVSVDAPTRAQLHALLQALWQKSRPTVLFVTHDVREAIALADRVLFLSAAPARVLLDLPVPLQRPRSVDDVEVDAVLRGWLDAHPQLLSGRLDGR